MPYVPPCPAPQRALLFEKRACDPTLVMGGLEQARDVR